MKTRFVRGLGKGMEGVLQERNALFLAWKACLPGAGLPRE